MANKILEDNWNNALENVQRSGSEFNRAKHRHRGLNVTEIVARQAILEQHIKALSQCATLIQGRSDVDTSQLKQWS